MSQRLQFAEQDYPAALVHRVCALAGNPNYLEDLQRSLRSAGIVKAVADHDTPKLFEWLVEAMSYQGIADAIAADAIAADYMARHGRATWRAVAAGQARSPSCPKLASYWQFHGCRYHKGTCAEPEHLPACPLPRLRLRNRSRSRSAEASWLRLMTSSNLFECAIGKSHDLAPLRMASVDADLTIPRQCRMRSSSARSKIPFTRRVVIRE